MIQILKFYFYRVTLLCLISFTVTAAQTFTGTELLARPTDKSITISIVSSSALEAYIEYGITSGAYTNETSHVTQTANLPIVIDLTGLTADTKYYYRFRYRTSGSSGSFSARTEYSFHTQRPAGSTFKFDITSDSHVNIMLGTLAFWTQTLNNIKLDNPDFLLDLGDTFAMDNVTTVSTAEANYLYQRSASTLGLISPSVPIYVVNGNHEQEEGWHLSDPGVPLATTPPVLGTNARKKYFPNPFPNDFYSGNTDATSTNISGNHLKEDYYAWQWGDVLFVVIDPFWYSMQKPFLGNIGGGEGLETGTNDRWDWSLGLDQFNWLKQTIENSTAKYKFVFSHQVVGGDDAEGYGRGGAATGSLFEWGGNNSDGSWGFDTERPGWGGVPVHQLMKANGVSAFFHGHDHQYAYELRDNIVYQEMPSAGFAGNGFAHYTEGGYTIKVLPSGGHLRVTVTPTQATVDYVYSTNSNGTVAYSYTILPNDPMPVELTTFTALVNKSIIILNWRTATEVKNYGFDIERKSNNSDWGKVGFVQGNGNSNVPKNYSFIDKEVATGKYFYRLKQIDIDGKYEYSKFVEANMGSAQSFELNQNYPNPFNPSTIISYRLKEKGFVNLKVYDIRGECVKVLVNETKEAGDYNAEFNGKGLASGVYIYRIEVTGNGNKQVYSDMKKTVLLK
ncbi:MAG: metallophosphoesterase [Ignavibacteriaceae bacterium]|nr:metallophosphoesterase [Ignavibacteriaceae bacterium]